MTIEAVIIAFNSEPFLGKCLNSLLTQKCPLRSILVVDNHSHDATLQIAGRFSGIELLRLDKNMGYTAAANLGIAKTRSNLILVANADTYFPPDFSQKIVDKFRENLDMDILAPLLLRFDQKTIDSAGQIYSWSLYPKERGFGRPRTSMKWPEGEVFSACGAVTLFSRNALEKLQVDQQYYDEDFFLFWEDFDLGWRAQILGLKTRFCPDILAFHFRSGTLKKNWKRRISLAWSRPPEIRFHLVKNRYLTLIKNFRFPRFWWTIPFILGKDILWTGALTISSPKIIIKLIQARGCFQNAWQKRKRLKAHE